MLEYCMNSYISTIHDMVQEINWQFEKHGINGKYCEDISIVEYMALKKAGEINEITIKDIASTLNFTSSGATRIISRLEEKGYVIRQHSPSDGRFCSVELTVKGRSTLEVIAKNEIEYLEKALTNLDQQAVMQIKETVEILSNAIKSKNYA